MRALLLAAICLTLLSGRVAVADELPEELYRAVVIVTGVEEPERTRGFREGLEEIIVKLTARPDLKRQPVLRPFLDRAGDYMASYTYEDRMKHLPVRDEQGTRDRPHYLRMVADAAKLEPALDAAGLPVWRSPRPQVHALIAVVDANGYRIVPSEGSDGYEQREVMKSAARRLGLGVVFPDGAAHQKLIASDASGDTKTSTLEGTLQRAERQARLWRAEAPFVYTAALMLTPQGYWNFSARLRKAMSFKPKARMNMAVVSECTLAKMDGVTFDHALRQSVAKLLEFQRLTRAAARDVRSRAQLGMKNGFCLN